MDNSTFRLIRILLEQFIEQLTTRRPTKENDYRCNDSFVEVDTRIHQASFISCSALVNEITLACNKIKDNIFIRI